MIEPSADAPRVTIRFVQAKATPEASRATAVNRVLSRVISNQISSLTTNIQKFRDKSWTFHKKRKKYSLPRTIFSNYFLIL